MGHVIVKVSEDILLAWLARVWCRSLLSVWLILTFQVLRGSLLGWFLCIFCMNLLLGWFTCHSFLRGIRDEVTKTAHGRRSSSSTAEFPYDVISVGLSAKLEYPIPLPFPDLLSPRHLLCSRGLASMTQTVSLPVLGVILIYSEESTRVRLPFEVPWSHASMILLMSLLQRPSLSPFSPRLTCLFRS